MSDLSEGSLRRKGFAFEVRKAIRAHGSRPVEATARKSAWELVPGSHGRPRYLQGMTTGFEFFGSEVRAFPVASEGHFDLRVDVGLALSGRESSEDRISDEQIAWFSDSNAVFEVRPREVVKRVSSEFGDVTVRFLLEEPGALVQFSWNAELALVIRVSSPQGGVARVQTESGFIKVQPEFDRAFLATHSNTRLTDPLAPDAQTQEVHLELIVGQGRDADGAVAPTVTWSDPVRPEATGTALQWKIPRGCQGFVPGCSMLRITVPAECSTAPEGTSRERSGGKGMYNPHVLDLDLPDEALQRQVGFSTENSLMSLTPDGRGELISLHGRPGDGFGYVAHLHQSYQMHYVALLCGQEERVRSEIYSFLSLINPDGRITTSPGPCATQSPYVSGYTEIHLVLAIARYVSMSGQTDILFERCPSGVAPTVLDTMLVLLDSLAKDTRTGLIAPCGWIDAWPEGVVAQGQVSMACIVALEAAARTLRMVGFSHLAVELEARQLALRSTLEDLLLQEDSGVFAEHLRSDGTVFSGTLQDFWIHTQIWSSMADLEGSRTAILRAANLRTEAGVPQCTPGTLEAPYLQTVFDPEFPADGEVTEVWVTAIWPELTNLLAKELARKGDADLALEMIKNQLPENLHTLNPVNSPWVYPEKTLAGDHLPWLSTWGGDPTLIEAIVGGFLGIDFRPGQMLIDPHLPESWRGDGFSASFRWQGQTWRVVGDPSRSFGTCIVDGTLLPLPAIIPASATKQVAARTLVLGTT